MNNESGSALQKASFALLVFIAAALAYLIVRERVRSQQHQAELAAAEAQGNAAPPAASSTLPTKSSFAPLRPRGDTGPVRPVGNTQTAPASRNFAPPPLPPSTPTANGSAGTVPVLAPTQPENVAETSGRDATGWTVSGRVFLRGAPPPEKPITPDATCGRLHPAPMATRHFVVNEEGALANVFVYAKSGISARGMAQASVPLLDNVNCEFQPYVLGVRVGQPFQIRNSDPLLHNIHALPKQNREFNLGLPVGNRTLQRFDRPEVFVQLKCDVHPWMFAYVGVVDHPWFAVTDTNGNFTLPSLPVRSSGQPRRLTIAAVHVKAGETVQEIEVGDKPPAPLNFTLDVPKPLATVETH